MFLPDDWLGIDLFFHIPILHHTYRNGWKIPLSVNFMTEVKNEPLCIIPYILISAFFSTNYSCSSFESYSNL